MRGAFLVLSAAVVMLTACHGAPNAADHHQTVHSSPTDATASPSAGAAAASSPGRSSSPLIADTAMDAVTCHKFAAEQAGHMRPDQFNTWLLKNGGQTTIGPQSSTGIDDTLSTNLADWYVVQASAPSGDLQPASYYAAQVRAECMSIGA